MHLADGVLDDLHLLVSLDLLGAAAVGYALARSHQGPRRGPAWLGTLGAFVLVVQALNLPMVLGASAHAVGASLLALLLGPARAVVALAAVLLVQALAFADGGLSVLGLNALNLAVLPVLAVVLVQRLAPGGPRGAEWAAWVGTPLGAVLGALSLGATLVVGAGAPPRETFGWLLGVQFPMGLVEGALTALAVRHLARRAPELLVTEVKTERLPLDAVEPRPPGLRWAALAVVLALAVLPLASEQPDALEVVLARMAR